MPKPSSSRSAKRRREPDVTKCTPVTIDQLRDAIDRLPDTEVREMYARMVLSGRYVPADVLGRELYFAAVDEFGREKVLQVVAETARGQLGI